MQQAFISNLRKLRNENESKSLLISATGTGKTYASAFALQDQNPKKALFLVHREQIAKQALQSYKNVFGESKTFGLLSGKSKDTDVDYLFATMQTMSKKKCIQVLPLIHSIPSSLMRHIALELKAIKKSWTTLNQSFG